MVQLQLFEALLFFFSLCDILLHLELLSEVHFLQFAKLAHSNELLLVAGQGFTHCELILVFTSLAVLAIAYWSMSHAELLSARRQMS